MIEAKNLFLSYTKDYFTLYDINIKINSGEKVVLCGKSESGKSSLLRVITGLEKPFSGSVTIKGIPSDKIDYQKDISLAYLPSFPLFMENKTVKQNLEYTLKIRKTNKQIIDVKISNIIRSFDIETILDMKLKNLSYFNRLKVALARFALRNIEVFIIDDVFVELNETESKKIIGFINDLVTVNSATLFIATSNDKYNKLLGERVINIENGSIVNYNLGENNEK